MTKADKGFMNTTEARHVRVGWVVGGVGDLFKSEWTVTEKEELEDGRIRFLMTCGGRTAKSEVGPTDIVFRYIDSSSLYN